MALFSYKRKPKVALCLSGGGARGYAHIGAIKAFIEEGIEFDLVTATSAGSIMAGLYCAGISPEVMEEYGESLSIKEIKSGFTPSDPMRIGEAVKKVVGSVRIEDLSIPLYIVSVDLVTAKQVILDKGLLYEAISASCAVPFFFKPLVKGRLHLVDGGLINNIPADIARMMGADYVITVDINSSRGGGTEGLGLLEVLKASFSIVTAAASEHGIINSDIIVAPDLSKFKATSKEGYKEMIDIGYLATKEKIDSIRSLVSSKRENKKRFKESLKKAEESYGE